MTYKIILDSCGELPESYKGDEHFAHVPLEVELDGKIIKDDENFNQLEFLDMVAKSSQTAKSACPSPDLYLTEYKCDADYIFVVTLSGFLSGSYNSACVASRMFLEKNPDRKIHVFDSCSASCGETQIAFFIQDLIEKGEDFDSIIEKTYAYRDELKTYFVLDTLDTFRKNGRLSGVKGLVASTLSIKPIMCGGQDGSIFSAGQAVGIKKALQKMVDIVDRDIERKPEKSLMITHCNCPERAERVKEMLLAKSDFKSVTIMPMAGISTTYACDGGIIVTV